jgi:hypothetical protein
MSSINDIARPLSLGNRLAIAAAAALIGAPFYFGLSVLMDSTCNALSALLYAAASAFAASALTVSAVRKRAWSEVRTEMGPTEAQKPFDKTES